MTQGTCRDKANCKYQYCLRGETSSGIKPVERRFDSFHSVLCNQAKVIHDNMNRPERHSSADNVVKRIIKMVVVIFIIIFAIMFVFPFSFSMIWRFMPTILCLCVALPTLGMVAWWLGAQKPDDSSEGIMFSVDLVD